MKIAAATKAAATEITLGIVVGWEIRYKSRKIWRRDAIGKGQVVLVKCFFGESVR